jgi:hypothetical protein
LNFLAVWWALIALNCPCRIGTAFGIFQLFAFCNKLHYVPAQPKQDPKDGHRHFPALKRIDCANSGQINRPVSYPIVDIISSPYCPVKAAFSAAITSD